MSYSVRPHRRQPTRLPHPWDSPGKNTGVGCHFLLQCMRVKIEREVAQSRSTLHNSMDCSPPGPSIHGTFQARILELGAIAFSADTRLLLLLGRFSRVLLCATPQTAAHQAPPSLGLLLLKCKGERCWVRRKAKDHTVYNSIRKVEHG